MANETAPTQTTDPGKTLLSWSFPEFDHYARGRTWYIVMGTLLALALLWAILTANFLFAFILLMAAAMYYLQTRRTPRTLTCVVSERGITLGTAFMPYRDLVNFWIVYHPPEVKRLYVRQKSVIRPQLVVPLESQNPLTLRKTLLVSLSEDLTQEDEPTMDQISRLLKI